MTPAEMREAAAALVERCEWYATASLGRLAAAIRALPLAEEAPPSLAAVLSALPHLTGDELRRVAEAMPRVAGEWLDDPEWLVRCYASEDGNGCFMAEACIRDDGWEGYVQGESIGTFPSPRAAQAACDARLEAAGVRLCGEVVRE